MFNNYSALSYLPSSLCPMALCLSVHPIILHCVSAVPPNITKLSDAFSDHHWCIPFSVAGTPFARSTQSSSRGSYVLRDFSRIIVINMPTPHLYSSEIVLIIWVYGVFYVEIAISTYYTPIYNCKNTADTLFAYLFFISMHFQILLLVMDKIMDHRIGHTTVASPSNSINGNCV